MLSKIDHDWVVLSGRLLQLYGFLLLGIGLGVWVGRNSTLQMAQKLANFLFWVGAPLTIVVFLHGVDFSPQVWLAPLVSWGVMLLAGGLSWLWIVFQTRFQRLGEPEFQGWRRSTQGSFILAAMAGNTGYIGYPIALVLAGQENFAWALFYDVFGTALGTYGLGVAVAAYFGRQTQNWRQLTAQILKNPPLWSFGIGFYFRNLPLAPSLLFSLRSLCWGVIFSSLILIGIRLSQLTAKQDLGQVMPALIIKMLFMPLITGLILSHGGVDGIPRLVMVLQTAMPPAFSSLVLAEIYQLDRDFSVAALVSGCLLLLLLLPLWLWLFAA